MKRLGIKSQILLMTLIPVFIIDVFFTYTHLDGRIEQANELLQSKGQIIARQLAGASEFNLFSGNDNQVQYLLDQSVGNNDIVLASIYDRHGNLVAKSVAPDYRQVDATDYYYYRESIFSQSVEHSDVFAPDFDNSHQLKTLGWVHLYISRKQLQQTKRQITIESIVFFLTILLIAIILTSVISRKITQPVFRLMEHLRLVETGQLGKAIDPVEDNEIGALQKGFNRMTHALLANRRHLNQRIQQATQQLNAAITDLETKNRELGFARDEAQNANRTKSEFLANMSHEIRTPINGITGFITLLSQSDLDHSQKRYVDIIHKSTSDLTNIVNEILDFSKMESGKLHIVDEEFDFYEVIEQTRDILFINVLTKNIDLNLIVYSDTPRRLIGDKLRLKQILLNLIGNAIKFTDLGRVAVKVSMLEMLEDKVQLEISVEDTGIGISEQDQQNLFQAFSQVETSDARRFTGTGLGLVISKNLATLMGGSIAMKSVPGEGSQFVLQLPFKYIEQSEDSVEASTVPNKALIFAAENHCLMETRALYDRAGVTTESSLINNRHGAESIIDCIQRNIAYIDLLIFDLRHLRIELKQLLTPEITSAVRVILMDYDRGLESSELPDGVEFVSVISTSQAITQLLATQTSSTTAPSEEQIDDPTTCKRVLLVDDNQVNLKLASELIRLWGHDVSEAEHGSIALELYEKNRFDLIILDIQMPDIDGVSLLHMMREKYPQDAAPVVALTANVLNDEAGRLLDLGFDYFLSKPLDEEKFRLLLNGSPKRRIIDRSNNDKIDPFADCSLDYARSLSLSANNESLLMQIFEIIQRDIPDQQNQLSNALQHSDRTKLAAITHKLHGVTCYASLPRLKRKLLGFQQQLSRGSDLPLDTAVTELNLELGTIKLEVDNHLERMREHGVAG